VTGRAAGGLATGTFFAPAPAHPGGCALLRKQPSPPAHIPPGPPPSLPRGNLGPLPAATKRAPRAAATLAAPRSNGWRTPWQGLTLAAARPRASSAARLRRLLPRVTALGALAVGRLRRHRGRQHGGRWRDLGADCERRHLQVPLDGDLAGSRAARV
jgi:hypothetical protein